MNSGLMSSLDNGKFGAAFASGFVSSAISSGIEALGQTDGGFVDGKTGKSIASYNNFGKSDWFKATIIVSGGVSGGLSSTIAGGNFMDGFKQGLITAGLNHVASLLEDQQPKPRKIIRTSKEATDHYYNGKGEDVELSRENQTELHKTTEYQRVVKRLITGVANNLSGSFDVDMTGETFHIGNTNVDYSTTCTTGKCTTIFNDFVRDGFWDPNFVAEKTLGRFFDTYKPDGIGPNLERPGGMPYNYTPMRFQITYKNPGYPVTR